MSVKLIPVSQACYAEKHKLYEMFTNLVKALVICQPSDPLRFIAWYMKSGRHVDVPKIILLAAPAPWSNANQKYVALSLAKSTGVVIVNRQNVMLRHARKRTAEIDLPEVRDKGRTSTTIFASYTTTDFYTSIEVCEYNMTYYIQGMNGCSTNFVTILIEYMRAKGTSKKGWLLLDVPNSKEESERMISLGILPTHTIFLNAAVPIGDQSSIGCEFNRSEFEIQTGFRSTLKELRVHGKSVDEITDLCLEQILHRKPSAVPFTPRVALIGPKGSGRSATASVMSKVFNIVHVDFNQILARKITDDGIEIPRETIHSWLKQKITENDCVEKGYVLTGFPRTRNDFEWLDSTEVAPNRVIFFAIDFREIYARSENKCIDKNTNTIVGLDQAASEIKAGTLKFKHVERYPSDSKKLFCEFKIYCNRLEDMLYYCGNDCFVVTVDESLCEKVSACIVSGSPTAAGGPRPQNRKPYRLTDSLYEKMLRSSDVQCSRATRALSDDARNLLHALEQKAKRDSVVPEDDDDI